MAIITNPYGDGLINVQGLNETATIIRPELLIYPVVYKKDFLRAMGVDTIGGIQDKMRQYDYERRGGLMRPYNPLMNASREKIGQIYENDLVVHLASGIHEDNIQDYKPNTVGGMSLLGTNKTYRNPAERLILYSLMATWTEDLMDVLFHGVRNPAGESPYDLFDGWYTQIQKYKLEGRINEANKNLVPTGAILSSGSDDTKPFYQIENFLSGVHPTLAGRPAILHVTQNTFNAYQLAAAKVFGSTLNVDQWGLIQLKNRPNIKMFVNPSMGEGDLLILTVDFNLQLGFDSLSDDEYVMVRNIKDDANIATMNIQARYGEAIRSIHAKYFCINDGSLTPISWSGDVFNLQHTVKASVVSNGTVSISPQKEKYDKEDEVTLTVSPESGYQFDQWSNGVTQNPLTIKVKGDTNLVATTKPQ